MDYITVKEASEKWGISERRVCILCKEGRIEGAVKRSKVWMIPARGNRPEDRRRKNDVCHVIPALLYLNTSFCDDKDVASLPVDAVELCQINKLFMNGKLAEAHDRLEHLISACKNDDYLFVLYQMKVLISIDLGYVEEVKLAKSKFEHLLWENPDKYKVERYCLLIDTVGEPLKEIDEVMYADVKSLVCFNMIRQKLEAMLKTSVNNVDMVSLEMAFESIKDYARPEILIYINIFFSVYYNLTGREYLRDVHLNKAIDMALPRKLYMPLAHYASTLDLTFLKEKDEEAYKIVIYLSDMLFNNYVKVGLFSNWKPDDDSFTVETLQVAFQIAMGRTNDEIRENMQISDYMLRQHISKIYATTGASTRKEVREIVKRNIVM